MTGMRRLLIAGAAAVGLVMAGATAPVIASAAGPAVSCAHVHMTFQFQNLDVANPVNVFSSSCAIGTATSTGAGGGGSVTLSTPVLPYPDAGFEEVQHFDLSLSVGSITVFPVFDAYMQIDFLDPGTVPNTTLDIGMTGQIVHFSSGEGTGLLQELCVYQPAANDESCTVDGSFVWAS